MSNPILVSSFLENNVESASNGTDADYGKNLPKSGSLTGTLKRYTSFRLAHLRYGLLILALAGVAWLLTGLLLHGLTAEKQDHSLTPTSNLVADIQIQSRQLHPGDILKTGKYSCLI